MARRMLACSGPIFPCLAAAVAGRANTLGLAPEKVCCYGTVSLKSLSIDAAEEPWMNLILFLAGTGVS